MRVLHLSSGISKQSAAYRLHQGLLSIGVESKILVCYNPIKDENIISPKNNAIAKLKVQLDRLPLKLYKRSKSKPFNVGWMNNYDIGQIKAFNPDIIHLHWISQFISFKGLKRLSELKIPIVWTMHDSWAFTGGCHIPYPCEKWKIKCEICPQLNSKKSNDLSNWIFQKKFKYWNDLPINVIGPSRWMTDCVSNSFLFRNKKVINIPNGIDLDNYKPIDKRFARKKLGLSLDKKILLFGANNALLDQNKGYYYLSEAFKRVMGKINNIELVIFGNREKYFDEDLKIRGLGYIHNPEMFPLIYSAADLTVNASISENFSNVILESLSCGTPVVAFDIGGNSDLIINNENGFLANPFDIEDLANQLIKGIALEFKDKTRFPIKSIAQKHLKFYESLR